jgi:hypothetical protein
MTELRPTTARTSAELPPASPAAEPPLVVDLLDVMPLDVEPLEIPLIAVEALDVDPLVIQQ